MDKSDFVPDKKYFVQADGEGIIIKQIKDKNPADDDGDTPPHLAALNGQFEVCKLIINMVEDKHPINVFGKTPKDVARRYSIWIGNNEKLIEFFK